MNNENAAFYARQGTRAADLWTLLHPPYTAWNMSYVAFGAALAPAINWPVLGLMLLAFFCGTGITAHALDEFNGRPLKTRFSDHELLAIAAAGLLACAVPAIFLVRLTSPLVLPLFGIGVFLVFAYNLEWWRGLFHNDLGFALSWGAFPVLAGYWTQTGTVSAAVLAAAAAATMLSLVQRSLSTAARFVRRRTTGGFAAFSTAGTDIHWEKMELLATWEKPLRLLSWSVVLLAFGLLTGKI